MHCFYLAKPPFLMKSCLCNIPLVTYIVMVFECFAIFGALLIGAVWLIFEWRYATAVDGFNETLDRVFDCMMAVALICNVFMTVFASWFWVSFCMHACMRLADERLYKPSSNVTITHSILLCLKLYRQVASCSILVKRISYGNV